MAAYARRHYAIDSYRLTRPHVIVEHFTANDSIQATINTFAPDVPDPELHELPGVCSHFVIGTDGTIVQMVPLGLMCRHTVGLNYTAIGIEHVGRSDAQVLGHAAELNASIRLTSWLRCQVPHRDRERDRPQREPEQPLPPRERRVAAPPDPRGYGAPGDAEVPGAAEPPRALPDLSDELRAQLRQQGLRVQRLTGRVLGSSGAVNNHHGGRWTCSRGPARAGCRPRRSFRVEVRQVALDDGPQLGHDDVADRVGRGIARNSPKAQWMSCPGRRPSRSEHRGRAGPWSWRSRPPASATSSVPLQHLDLQDWEDKRREDHIGGSSPRSRR